MLRLTGNNGAAAQQAPAGDRLPAARDGGAGRDGAGPPQAADATGGAGPAAGAAGDADRLVAAELTWQQSRASLQAAAALPRPTVRGPTIVAPNAPTRAFMNGRPCRAFRVGLLHPRTGLKVARATAPLVTRLRQLSEAAAAAGVRRGGDLGVALTAEIDELLAADTEGHVRQLVTNTIDALKRSLRAASGPYFTTFDALTAQGDLLAQRTVELHRFVSERRIDVYPDTDLSGLAAAAANEYSRFSKLQSELFEDDDAANVPCTEVLEDFLAVQRTAEGLLRVDHAMRTSPLATVVEVNNWAEQVHNLYPEAAGSARATRLLDRWALDLAEQRRVSAACAGPGGPAPATEVAARFVAAGGLVAQLEGQGVHGRALALAQRFARHWLQRGISVMQNDFWEANVLAVSLENEVASTLLPRSGEVTAWWARCTHFRLGHPTLISEAGDVVARLEARLNVLLETVGACGEQALEHPVRPVDAELLAARSRTRRDQLDAGAQQAQQNYLAGVATSSAISPAGQTQSLAPAASVWAQRAAANYTAHWEQQAAAQCIALRQRARECAMTVDRRLHDNRLPSEAQLLDWRADAAAFERGDIAEDAEAAAILTQCIGRLEAATSAARACGHVEADQGAAPEVVDRWLRRSRDFLRALEAESINRADAAARDRHFVSRHVAENFLAHWRAKQGQRDADVVLELRNFAELPEHELRQRLRGIDCDNMGLDAERRAVVRMSREIQNELLTRTTETRLDRLIVAHLAQAPDPAAVADAADSARRQLAQLRRHAQPGPCHLTVCATRLQTRLDRLELAAAEAHVQRLARALTDADGGASAAQELPARMTELQGALVGLMHLTEDAPQRLNGHFEAIDTAHATAVRHTQTLLNFLLRPTANAQPEAIAASWATAQQAVAAIFPAAERERERLTGEMECILRPCSVPLAGDAVGREQQRAEARRLLAVARLGGWAEAVLRARGAALDAVDRTGNVVVDDTEAAG